VVSDIPTSAAIKTEINQKSISRVFDNTIIRKYATSQRLIIFPATNDTRENSIFICDCISARKVEFIKLTTVKAPIINIAQSVKGSPYHGRTNASKKAQLHMIHQRIVLKVRTFPIIFSLSSFPSDISLTAIV